MFFFGPQIQVPHFSVVWRKKLVLLILLKYRSYWLGQFSFDKRTNENEIEKKRPSYSLK